MQKVKEQWGEMSSGEKWETWEAQFRKKGMSESQIQAKKKQCAAHRKPIRCF